MVEVQLLGPVQLLAADRPVDLGPKRRAVLAALAAEANQPVSVAQLIERVWDDAPPAARDVLYSHLSAVRRILRQATEAAPEPAVLLRRNSGYILRVDPGRVDAHRFRSLMDQARQDACPVGRAGLLRRALDLWRGPALADLSTSWAERTRDAWQQRRLTAVRQWAEAELQAGRPAAVVADLFALTAEYPLVEPLLALLMRALHADGRDAEALDRYFSVRRRLAEELGVGPGTELRSVHQAILRGTLPPLATVQPTGAATPAQIQPAAT